MRRRAAMILAAITPDFWEEVQVVQLEGFGARRTIFVPGSDPAVGVGVDWRVTVGRLRLDDDIARRSQKKIKVEMVDCCVCEESGTI
jgi:hypothetical protein